MLGLSAHSYKQSWAGVKSRSLLRSPTEAAAVTHGAPGAEALITNHMHEREGWRERGREGVRKEFLMQGRHECMKQKNKFKGIKADLESVYNVYSSVYFCCFLYWAALWGYWLLKNFLFSSFFCHFALVLFPLQFAFGCFLYHFARSNSFSVLFLPCFLFRVPSFTVLPFSCFLHRFAIDLFPPPLCFCSYLFYHFPLVLISVLISFCPFPLILHKIFSQTLQHPNLEVIYVTSLSQTKTKTKTKAGKCRGLLTFAWELFSTSNVKQTWIFEAKCHG